MRIAYLHVIRGCLHFTLFLVYFFGSQVHSLAGLLQPEQTLSLIGLPHFCKVNIRMFDTLLHLLSFARWKAKRIIFCNWASCFFSNLTLTSVDQESV